VTYALFHEGKVPVADPTVLEERVSDASLVLAVNQYKELCCMQLTGVSLTSPMLIMQCTEWAAERAKRIVDFIKASLEEDSNERAKGNIPKGFAESIQKSNIKSNLMGAEVIEKISEVAMDFEIESESENENAIVKIDEKTVSSNNWGDSDENSSAASSNDDEEMPTRKHQKSHQVETVKISSGDSSEEEEVVVLK
jgi:hypothetical protein